MFDRSRREAPLQVHLHVSRAEAQVSAQSKMRDALRLDLVVAEGTSTLAIGRMAPRRGREQSSANITLQTRRSALPPAPR